MTEDGSSQLVLLAFALVIPVICNVAIKQSSNSPLFLAFLEYLIRRRRVFEEYGSSNAVVVQVQEYFWMITGWIRWLSIT